VADGEESWFGNFALRLLQNEPAVTRLARAQSICKQGPALHSATLFKYEFTTKEEHHATGAWWSGGKSVSISEVSLP